MANPDNLRPNGATALAGSVGNSHSITDSEASGDVTMMQEADTQSVVKSEAADEPMQSRVAVLSSTPKPRIADLTEAAEATSRGCNSLGLSNSREMPRTTLNLNHARRSRL